MPVVYKLCLEYEDGTDFKRMRSMMLGHLCTYYDCMDTSGMYMTKECADTLQHSVEHALIFYHALSSYATHSEKKYKWSIVNKHHMWWHIAEGARFLNPRWSWCYMGEDFMRHITRIATTTMMGSGILSLSQKLCERWRIGRYIRGFANIPIPIRLARGCLSFVPRGPSPPPPAWTIRMMMTTMMVIWTTMRMTMMATGTGRRTEEEGGGGGRRRMRRMGEEEEEEGKDEGKDDGYGRYRGARKRRRRRRGRMRRRRRDGGGGRGGG